MLAELRRSRSDLDVASIPANLGVAIWSLLTNVRFAVIQITVIVCAALVGMIVHQIPAYAIGASATPADYQREMAKLHAEYDPALGRAVVGLFEQIGFFRVFTTVWFAALLALLFVSILACTLDRLPRLWSEVRHVRVVQPDEFFDPELPGRAVFEPVEVSAGGSGGSGGSIAGVWSTESVRSVLRRKRFRVRQVESAGSTFLYGDRNQYTKLATLITHAGLLLFILAAGVTANGIPFLGLYPANIPIVLAQDQTQTIQPIGTPNLLIVKNLGFSAPRDASGAALDFTTDLAIYQNGVQVARKTIRVNDPLSYDGYTFHQNFTGPAPELTIRDSAGSVLWTGPVPLDDAPVGGGAAKRLVVPGRDLVLDLVLVQSGSSQVLLATASRQTNVDAQGQPVLTPVMAQVMDIGSSMNDTADGFTVAYTGMTSYTGLIARSDPGEYIVWVAFGLLIVGLLITFYLPRRRLWLRLDRDGTLAVVGRSDRYVPFEREFASLLEALAAARREAGGVAADGGAAV